MFNRFIRIFQIYISPQDGPNCRYSPTCSRYATECIDQYGIITGTIMAADRYMRCNPFGTWGKDLPQDNYIFK
ncbi:MAG: membrane protein insertion efficiency factor YidD [Spirochaetes bacterium]|nr:membrane protein insertion efficiency factor YidD [Spirochaetota bacterium]